MPREAPVTRAVFPESVVMILLPSGSWSKLAPGSSRGFADRSPRRLEVSGVDGRRAVRSPAGYSKRELAARPLLNRADAVGIERDVVLDRGDRRVGLLVGPDSI